MEVGSTILLVGIGFMSVILLSTLILLIWYSGYLENVSVGAGQPPCGTLNVMYSYGTGPYKNVGSVFTVVTALAPEKKCFGIYYDDPNQVASRKLRWCVGCVLSEEAEESDSSLVKAFEEEGFKKYCLPAVNNAVISSFPYRSQLSVLVGIYRAYPEMASYIRSMKLCAHPFIELYAGNQIHFYAPLSKQECFYVPETDPNYMDLRQLASVPHGPPPGFTQVSTDPGEGTSKVAGAEDSKKHSENVGVELPQEHITPKLSEDDPTQAAPRRDSTQRVPEITELLGEEASNKTSDGLAGGKGESIVPDTCPTAEHKHVATKRGSKSMSKSSAKSELTAPSQTVKDAKLGFSRAKSEHLTSASGRGDDADHQAVRDLTGVSNIVQDSGVTSTIGDAVNHSSSEDSYTEDPVPFPGSSPSLYSGSSYLSSDHSYSYSSQSVLSSDTTAPSQQDSGLTEPSQTSNLVELSSDSDGEATAALKAAASRA